MMLTISNIALTCILYLLQGLPRSLQHWDSASEKSGLSPGISTKVSTLPPIAESDAEGSSNPPSHAMLPDSDTSEHDMSDATRPGFPRLPSDCAAHTVGGDISQDISHAAAEAAAAAPVMGPDSDAAPALAAVDTAEVAADRALVLGGDSAGDGSSDQADASLSTQVAAPVPRLLT